MCHSSQSLLFLVLLIALLQTALTLALGYCSLKSLCLFLVVSDIETKEDMGFTVTRATGGTAYFFVILV